MYKTPSVSGGVVARRGAVLLVDAISMAVSYFICATFSLLLPLLSSIIAVVALVAMALAAILGISLRLMVSLIPPPTDLSSCMSCSNAFAYAVMVLYSSVEGLGAAGGESFLRGSLGLLFSLKAANDSKYVRCDAHSAALVTTPYSLTKCFTVLAQFL